MGEPEIVGPESASEKANDVRIKLKVAGMDVMDLSLTHLVLMLLMQGNCRLDLSAPAQEFHIVMPHEVRVYKPDWAQYESEG